MGITWDEREKIAFAMVILPDGRIVCQRPSQPTFVKVWQATACTKMSTYSSNPPEMAIVSSKLLLRSVFEIDIPTHCYTHFLSHYVENMGKRLEIVTCKLPSQSRIKVSNNIDVRFITLESLLYEIEKNRGAFAPQTLHAVNVISGAWRP